MTKTKKLDSAYIPSLDGFRAISILIVFCSHAGLSTMIPGTFGVTVFFFLSGYLITTLLRQEWAKAGTIDLGQFYLRRLLRIFPPLYLSIIAASLVSLVLVPAVLTWEAFFAQGLFLANYYEIFANAHGMPPSMGVLWSLAVEEHFYAFFPLLYIGLHKSNARPARQALVLLALCAAVLVWRIILVRAMGVDTADGARGWHRMAHSSDTRIDGILAGCILAIYGNPYLDPTRIKEAVWKYVLMPLGLLALLMTFAYRNMDFRETYRYSLQALALVPLFVVAVRFPTWWPMRPLNWAWMRRLGVFSYSFYLLHNIVIEVIDAHVAAPLVVRMGLSFALSYGASALMFRAVEKPCAKLRKRLSARSAAKPASATAESPASPAY